MSFSLNFFNFLRSIPLVFFTKIFNCIWMELFVLIECRPVALVFGPRALKVPLPVDERALCGPLTLGGGYGGAETLVAGLVRVLAADETVGVEDLAYEVEGLQAVRCLLRQRDAWRAMQNCLRTMEPSSGLLVCVCAICVDRLNRRLVLL